jgi:hypothetical protein
MDEEEIGPGWPLGPKSAAVHLERDGDGWVATDTDTGERERADSAAEAFVELTDEDGTG